MFDNFRGKVQWFRENLEFAFTGDPSVVQVSVFERGGKRFYGKNALVAYEEVLAEQYKQRMGTLRQRWQDDDDSPDFTRAATELRKQYDEQLTKLKEQFA